jgi:hypothetical protein
MVPSAIAKRATSLSWPQAVPARLLEFVDPVVLQGEEDAGELDAD